MTCPATGSNWSNYVELSGELTEITKGMHDVYLYFENNTGKMAVKILTGEADISEMPIEYYQNPVKKYMASRCEALGIEIPEGYEAIAE